MQTEKCRPKQNTKTKFDVGSQGVNVGISIGIVKAYNTPA